MLAQLAVIVFAIFGVLALVVDIGYARLTQMQMQNAADAASVEGLRTRNLRSDPFESDCKRRSAGRDVVTWMFDDDFVIGEDEFRYGAGPRYALGEGATELNARQKLDPADPSVYKPALQRNQSGNLSYGDMVSGTFDPLQSPAEDGTYARLDFTPAPPVPPGNSLLPGCPADDDFTAVPPSGGSPIADNAFLVRLRRTDDPDDLDEVPDVSSRDAPLPMLFGRGTTIAGADAGAPYSVRRDGLTIRATAIARVGPARRIGAPSPLLPELGAVSFAIDLACWVLLPIDGVPATVDSAGTIQSAGCAGVAGRLIHPARQVADLVIPRAPVPGPFDEAGFVAIYQTVNGADRVVGFGRAAMCGTSEPDGLCTSAATIPGTVQLRRRSVRVAARNASAHIPGGILLDSDPAHLLTGDDITGLLTANQALDGALLVPVLGR